MNIIDSYFASKNKHNENKGVLAKDLPRLAKELRQKNKWSQRKLGELLGKDHTTISQIERGILVPSDEVLQRINILSKESNDSN